MNNTHKSTKTVPPANLQADKKLKKINSNFPNTACEEEKEEEKTAAKIRKNRSYSVLPKEERKALGECLKMLEINRKRFILASLFGSGAIGSGIGLGSVSAWLIARAAQLPPVLDLSVAATAVRAFGVGKAVFRYLERISSHWIALQGMASIRTRVYERLANAPIDTVTAIKRGDLLARTGVDVDELGDVVVKSLLPAVVAIITSLISVAIVATLSPIIGLILAVCLLIAGVISPYLAMRGARIAEIQQLQDRSELHIQALTLLENAEELRISGKLTQMEAAQAATEIRIQKNRDKAAIPTSLAAAIDLLALGISVIAALWIGSAQVAAGSLDVLGLVVVTLTPLAAFESTQRLSGAGVQLVRSARAAIRIIEMIEPIKSIAPLNADTENQDSQIKEIHTTSTNAAKPELPLSLIAKDLTIGWPGGTDIASGINLNLTPGKTIAIVGPSGIGKSTLLYTLAGMIKPHHGSVTLGGIEVGNIDRKKISQHLILTAEDAHIFETSVLENIRVVRADVTAQEAISLLHSVGLGQWLAQLPDGVDTMLGGDGATVSGGERRRLLLARALASAADFLLLDEPGEHLDAKTADQLIRDLLHAGKNAKSNHESDCSSAEQKPIQHQQRGIILITHRLNPLDAADEVIMLGNNPTQIIARGTHAQLLAKNPLYRWSLEQETAGFTH